MMGKVSLMRCFTTLMFALFGMALGFLLMEYRSLYGSTDMTPEDVQRLTDETLGNMLIKPVLPSNNPPAPSLPTNQGQASGPQPQPQTGTQGQSALSKLKANLAHYPEKRATMNVQSLGGLPLARPKKEERKFTSDVIETVIEEVGRRMKDDALAMLFANCYPNTVDTTVLHFDNDKPDTFVITGDIPAQWLRDSTNQVLPYIPFANDDSRLKNLICGLIRRHTRDIILDPYANAFNYEDSGGEWQHDQRKPPMTKHLWEGKYELDSLGATMKLSYRYYEHTKDLKCFDATWVKAMGVIMDTIETQMKGTDEEGNNPPYTFKRNYAELRFEGRGPPGKRCGLSKCGFRPSDDSVEQPFLIPANAMAVVELRHTAEILEQLAKSQAGDTAQLNGLSQRATAMAKGMQDAIYEHGVVKQDGRPDIFAYEVNCNGAYNKMDDANIPSLLSLPYLGFVAKNDELYKRTRNFVWSRRNPWFFEGAAAHGIGGPHCGHGMIWPMAIIMRAITSESDAEIAESLQWIRGSSAGTGLLHESFWQDNSSRFTRSWFAWVNTLFGELILQLARERPHLVFDVPPPAVQQ